MYLFLYLSLLLVFVLRLLHAYFSPEEVEEEGREKLVALLPKSRNSSLLTIIYQPCNFRTIPAISQKSRKKFLFSYECLSFLHPKNHMTATVLLHHFTLLLHSLPDFIHVRSFVNLASQTSITSLHLAKLLLNKST